MHAYQPERLTKKPSRSFQFLDGLLCHPRLCIGAALSLAIMTMICINAIWYQPGKHPAPLFATRGIDHGELSKTRTAALTKTRTERKAVLKKKSAEVGSGELLREVQTALSVRGYYEGKLDGVYGSRSRKAIIAFQKDHNLPQDGQVNLSLLTQVLLSASSRPRKVPVPSTVQIVDKPTKVKTVKVSVPKSVEPADGLVARIQAGLRAYGYDELVVDGRMGQQTATAIQRFQLDYGMKITGEPSKTVLNKLRDIGAYKQG